MAGAMRRSSNPMGGAAPNHASAEAARVRELLEPLAVAQESDGGRRAVEGALADLATALQERRITPDAFAAQGGYGALIVALRGVPSTPRPPVAVVEGVCDVLQRVGTPPPRVIGALLEGLKTCVERDGKRVYPRVIAVIHVALATSSFDAAAEIARLGVADALCGALDEARTHFIAPTRLAVVLETMCKLVKLNGSAIVTFTSRRVAERLIAIAKDNKPHGEVIMHTTQLLEYLLDQGAADLLHESSVLYVVIELLGEPDVEPQLAALRVLRKYIGYGKDLDQGSLASFLDFFARFSGATSPTRRHRAAQCQRVTAESLAVMQQLLSDGTTLLTMLHTKSLYQEDDRVVERLVLPFLASPSDTLREFGCALLREIAQLRFHCAVCKEVITDTRRYCSTTRQSFCLRCPRPVGYSIEGADFRWQMTRDSLLVPAVTLLAAEDLKAMEEGGVQPESVIFNLMGAFATIYEMDDVGGAEHDEVFRIACELLQVLPSGRGNREVLLNSLTVVKHFAQAQADTTTMLVGAQLVNTLGARMDDLDPNAVLTVIIALLPYACESGERSCLVEALPKAFSDDAQTRSLVAHLFFRSLSNGLTASQIQSISGERIPFTTALMNILKACEGDVETTSWCIRAIALAIGHEPSLSSDVQVLVLRAVLNALEAARFPDSLTVSAAEIVKHVMTVEPETPASALLPTSADRRRLAFWEDTPNASGGRASGGAPPVPSGRRPSKPTPKVIHRRSVSDSMMFACGGAPPETPASTSTSAATPRARGYTAASPQHAPAAIGPATPLARAAAAAPAPSTPGPHVPRLQLHGRGGTAQHSRGASAGRHSSGPSQPQPHHLSAPNTARPALVPPRASAGGYFADPMVGVNLNNLMLSTSTTATGTQQLHTPASSEHPTTTAGSPGSVTIPASPQELTFAVPSSEASRQKVGVFLNTGGLHLLGQFARADKDVIRHHAAIIVGAITEGSEDVLRGRQACISDFIAALTALANALRGTPYERPVMRAFLSLAMDDVLRGYFTVDAYDAVVEGAASTDRPCQNDAVAILRRLSASVGGPLKLHTVGTVPVRFRGDIRQVQTGGGGLEGTLDGLRKSIAAKYSDTPLGSKGIGRLSVAGKDVTSDKEVLSLMSSGTLAAMGVDVEVTGGTTSPVMNTISPSTSRKKLVKKKRRWKIGEKIGSGAFGTVHHAVDEDTTEQYAAKVFTLKSDKKHLDESYLNEITLLSTLEHENIVRYIDTDKRGDLGIIILELMPGGSLLDFRKKFDNKIQEQMAAKFIAHALNGLDFLHKHGVIHLDVKSANLLVDTSGVVKVADFGCGIRFEVDGDAVSKDGQTTGTLPFMAPEAMIERRFGTACDIWSLGCTLIEMICGGLIWCPRNVEPSQFVYAMKREWKEGLTPLHHVRKQGYDLSDPCLAFLERSFHFEPAKRASASQLLQDPFIANTDKFSLTDSSLELDASGKGNRFLEYLNQTHEKLERISLDGSLSSICVPEAMEDDDALINDTLRTVDLHEKDFNEINVGDTTLLLSSAPPTMTTTLLLDTSPPPGEPPPRVRSSSVATGTPSPPPRHSGGVRDGGGSSAESTLPATAGTHTPPPAQRLPDDAGLSTGKREDQGPPSGLGRRVNSIALFDVIEDEILPDHDDSADHEDALLTSLTERPDVTSDSTPRTVVNHPLSVSGTALPSSYFLGMNPTESAVAYSDVGLWHDGTDDRWQDGTDDTYASSTRPSTRRR